MGREIDPIEQLKEAILTYDTELAADAAQRIVAEKVDHIVLLQTPLSVLEIYSVNPSSTARDKNKWPRLAAANREMQYLGNLQTGLQKVLHVSTNI